MPRSEKSKQAFAMTSLSRSKPIAANSGAAGLEVKVGRALCATTQTEQEAESLWVG
jgi:hypothetical protein